MRIHFKHSVELVDDNAEIVDRPGGRRGLHAGEGYLRRGGEALAEGAHPIMPGGQDSRGQRSGMTQKKQDPGHDLGRVRRGSRHFGCRIGWVRQTEGLARNG